MKSHANIDLFLQDAVKDINYKENRSGQLIFSPHWYSFVYAILLLSSFALIYFLKDTVSPYLFVGLFPFYLLAIIYIFESKQEYHHSSSEFLKHRIARKHLARFYQSLDSEDKANFREIILTKKDKMTYEDIRHLG